MGVVTDEVTDDIIAARHYEADPETFARFQTRCDQHVMAGGGLSEAASFSPYHVYLQMPCNSSANF